MKFTILIENNECIEMSGLACEHGLSVYVETNERKILFDAGQTGAAIDNAKKLGIDVSEASALVLSHGHYDHTGGTPAFAELNDKAPIYLQSTAVKQFKNGTGKYIGIDYSILDLPQLRLLTGDTKLGDDFEIFTDINGRKFFPEGNKTLTMEKDGEWVQDDFSHEQCAVIREGDKTLLLSGCAHNGILNILAKYREKFGDYPSFCISGFHMMKQDGYTERDYEIIEETAKELLKIPTIFYTGHCTMHEPFVIMKKIMGDKIFEINTGLSVELF